MEPGTGIPEPKREMHDLGADGMPKELQAGDIRRWGCGNPNHPFHVAVWDGETWRRAPDRDPLSAAIIGATLMVETYG